MTVEQLVEAMRTLKRRHAAEIEELFARARSPGIKPLTVIVPANFAPGSGAASWAQLAAAAARVPLIVVANPHNGPGATRHLGYRQAIATVAAAGARVVGYVDAAAPRTPASVLAEVAQWRVLYPEIDGIFFDGQPLGPEHVDTFARYFAAARVKQGDLVISNPGAPCHGAYSTIGAPDILVMTHGPAPEGLYELPAWARDVPAKHFAAIVTGAGPEAMESLVATARFAGYGAIYVTSTTDETPAYFDREIALVAES